MLLGDLVGERVLEPILRLRFPAGDPGRELEVELSLEGAEGPLPAPPVRLVFRYADDRANDVQPRDIEVEYGTAGMMAASARRRALRLNRQGRYEEAAAEIRRVAECVSESARYNPRLLPLAERLRDEAAEYEAAMDELRRKSLYASSTYELTSRSEWGTSLRSRRRREDRDR